MIPNSVIFLVSNPTCHENSLRHAHIAWGWTTLLLPDETELKLDQRCLSAPRPASDWLCSWNLNPVVFWAITHTHAQRGEFMCVFFVPGLEIWAALAELDSSWWYTLLECHSRLRLWDECCDPNQAPWIRGQYIHNRTQIIWVRGHKPSHYSKPKLKALSKPNEIYHFPVNTKWIHRRLLC